MHAASEYLPPLEDPDDDVNCSGSGNREANSNGGDADAEASMMAAVGCDKHNSQLNSQRNQRQSKKEREPPVREVISIQYFADGATRLFKPTPQSDRGDDMKAIYRYVIHCNFFILYTNLSSF